MLRFTPEQELAVNAARQRFNETQVALAASMAASPVFEGNAAPIPLDAWRRIDARGAMIQRDVLAVFNRLAAANTTPVGVADLVNFYPKISDSGEVHVSLDGRSEGRQDQAVVQYAGTPVPVIDSYARFGWRQMEMIRKGAGSLDTDTVANHQRKVAEKLEDMALNGLTSIVVGGNTIYGLRTFPDRSAGTHGLTLSSSTGAQWLTAVRQIITLLEADNAFEKVTIFVNWADWSYASAADYATNYPKTIAERLRELGVELVPGSKVPANELIGIAGLAGGEWGSILSAMPMITRPKARHNPEDDYVMGVMAMAAPQFRSDANSRSRIAHTTTA
jgi:uncharacterized linocin/CFP29 family protein